MKILKKYSHCIIFKFFFLFFLANINFEISYKIVTFGLFKFFPIFLYKLITNFCSISPSKLL